MVSLEGVTWESKQFLGWLALAHATPAELQLCLAAEPALLTARALSAAAVSLPETLRPEARLLPPPAQCPPPLTAFLPSFAPLHPAAVMVLRREGAAPSSQPKNQLKLKITSQDGFEAQGGETETGGEDEIGQ